MNTKAVPHMPKTIPPVVTFQDVMMAAPAGSALSITANSWADKIATDKWLTWDAIVDAGRRTMAGKDFPLKRFLETHSSTVCPWHKKAFAYCFYHPYETLVVRVDMRVYGRRKVYEWEISRRGEYVMFRLPYHGNGGERTWVSRDGKTKVLIDVD